MGYEIARIAVAAAQRASGSLWIPAGPAAAAMFGPTIPVRMGHFALAARPKAQDPGRSRGQLSASVTLVVTTDFSWPLQNLVGQRVRGERHGACDFAAQLAPVRGTWPWLAT